MASSSEIIQAKANLDAAYVVYAKANRDHLAARDKDQRIGSAASAMECLAAWNAGLAAIRACEVASIAYDIANATGTEERGE